MDRRCLVVMTLGALFVGSGCSSEDDDLAVELWTQMEGSDLGYRSWPQFPGYEEPMLSESHAGYTVRTYINDVVADFVATGTWDGQVPVESLIVKESFFSTDGMDVSADLRNITVMWKVEGYAPDAGVNNWFFANYNPDGSIAEGGDGKIQGQPANCVDCHAIDAANDYIRLYDFAPEE